MKVSFFTDFFSRRPRTLTASLLCVTLLFSDLPAQAQTPALPLSPAQVLIPAEYGRVEESRQAGSKTIFFLQDAHDSLEAQENIAALIRHLVENSGIKTVFEEGYEGPVPADDYFGPLKDSEVREKVSYYLLDQLRIGGAEYAHINRKQPFKLMGGDDARLHRENIAWYRKTAEHQEEASQGLNVLRQEIARLADKNFPAELKEWMKLKTRVDQGKISFWDYLQRLREPGFAFFHDGLPTEAMTSRYPVLSRLYRAAMKDLSQELQDGDVNEEVLFRETSDFENAIADTLITLERDRQTFTFYKTLELLLRLNSLEVSYDEYQALRGTLPQAATEDFARFISLHANRSVSLSKRWEENVRNAMQFYETAGARDRAVEKKLIEFKADAAESSAVLVFGGFHRSAIREILRRQGFSYQIISPVISEPQEKHRERYRHLMAADYETRFVPASVSAASRALSDIAVAELSPVYKRRFAEELNVLSRAAMNVRGGSGGDLLLGMQQELKKQPEILRSELRAEGKFQRGERLTQEKLEEEVRKLGETSLEVGGNDRTGWAVSTEKRYEHDRLHALEIALSKRFKGYRFSYYYDVRTDQDFKRLDILPPLSRRSELRPGLKNVDAEVQPHASKDPQAADSGLSGRSELRGVNGILLGAGVFENPLWLLAVPPALAAAVYFLYQSYHLWISKRIASALAQGARYIARGSYTHVLKHAGFPGYVILVKRHPFVMRLKQGEAIRSPQVTEAEEWKAYKALKKLGLAPFTRYAGKFPMKNMHPEWAGTDGEDVFRADQKKLAEMYGKVSSSMMGVSVYLQEEGVPLNQFVRENPDQKILADKSLAGFTLKLWNAGWIDLDIGRRNYLLVTDREGKPLKNPDGLLRLKAHDFGAIMPIPEDLEQFMLSKHTDSDVTRGFFLLRNLTATVRAAAVLFPRLDLKKFHEISKAADEAAERMKTRGDKAAFRQAYLGVIESPQNKKVITELSIDAARMIRKALEGAARSELRAEDAGEGKDRKRIKQRVREEAEKRVLAARKVLRTRIIFIGFASAALLAGGAVYWMLPNVPAQPAAAAPSEAVIERQRFATIRGIHIADSTRNNSSQRPELIDAIAEGYDAADRVRKSQIASYELIEGQAPVEEGQTPGVVFQVQPHTPLDVAPPFEPVQIRRDAAGRLSPVDLQGVRNSVSGGRIQTVEQVREWMAWLPLAAVGLMAVLAYAFLKGVRRVDTGSIMDVKNASDRSARDVSKLRAAAEKKNKENEGGSGRSELRVQPEIDRLFLLKETAKVRAAHMKKMNRELLELFPEWRRLRRTAEDSAAAEALEKIRAYGAGLQEFSERIAPDPESANPADEKARYAAVISMDLSALRDHARSLDAQIRALTPEFVEAYRLKDLELLETLNKRVSALHKERIKTQLRQTSLHLANASPNESAVLALLVGLHNSYQRLAQEYAWRWRRAVMKAGTEKIRVVGRQGDVQTVYDYETFRIFKTASAEEGGEDQVVMIQNRWKRYEHPDGRAAYRLEPVRILFEDEAAELRSQIHTLVSQENDYSQLLFHINALDYAADLLKAHADQLPGYVMEQIESNLAEVLEGEGGLSRGKTTQKLEAAADVEAALAGLRLSRISEPLGLLQDAIQKLQERLKEIEGKRDGVFARAEFIADGIRKTETWRAVKAVETLVIERKYQEAGELLNLVYDTHYQPIGRAAPQYQAVKTHLTRVRDRVRILAGSLAQEPQVLPGIREDLRRLELMTRTPPRSELRSADRQINVYRIVDAQGKEIGVYRKRIPKAVFDKLDNVTVRGFRVSDAVRMGERSWYYVNARNDLMGVPAEARVEKGLVTELKFLKPEGEEIHTFSRIYTRDDAGERQLTDVFPFELTPKKLKTLEKATVTQYRLDKIGSLMIGGRHWARFPKYPNASVEVDIDQGLITNTRIVNDQGTVLEEFPMMTVWNSEGKLEEVFYEKITFARLAKLNRVTLKGLFLSKSTGQLQIGGGRHWTSLEKHKGARVEADFEEGLVVTVRVIDGKGKVRATYPMGRIYKEGKLVDVYHRQMTPKKFKTLDGVVIKTRLDPRGAMTLGDRNWVVLKNYKLFPIEADVSQGFVTEVRVLDPQGGVLKAFPFYQVHDESGRIVEVFPSRFTPHKKEKLKKPGSETAGEANRAVKVVKDGEVFPAEGPWKNISKKDLLETQQGVLKGLALGRTSGALRVGGRRWIALTQYRGYAAEADIESGRVVTVRVLDPEGEVIKTVELPRVYENGQFVDVMRHGHQNKLNILARDVTIKKLRLTKDGVLFFANQYWGVFSDHRRAPIEIDIKDKRIVEVRISNPDGSVLETHKAKRILNMKGEVVSVFYGTVLPAQLKKMGKVRVEGLKFNGSGSLLFGGVRIYSDSNFPNASADIVYDAAEGKVHEVHVVKDSEGNPVDYLYRGSDLTQKRSRMEYYSERGRVFEAALKWTLEILGEPFEYQKHFHEDAWDEPEATGHVPDFTNIPGEIFASETLHYIDAKFNMLFGSSLDEYLPIIRGRLQKEWQVDVENPSADDFVKKVIFELVYLGSNQEAKLDQKIAKFKETFSAAHPEILDIRVTSFWDAYAPRLEAAGRHDLVEFLQILKNFHYKKGRSAMLAAFRSQLMEKKAPRVHEPVSTQAELFSIDAESSVEGRRDPGPRSELRAQPQGDVFAGLKASLLKLMTSESAEEKNAVFNSVARSLTKANSSVKGKFRRVLLELLDNRLEERALWAIGSRERETSAGQRAVYRRLHEHLYDERGSLRKDIKKLETAPSAALTLKYEDTFTVRAGRRKETLRVERLTSLSHSDWSQIFEIYAPHNLREFHRDLMSGRRSLSGKENAVFVVRTSENKIAGFSWAFADPGKKMLGLAVSGVAKPYRGKGLAARLLISRLEWGVSNGLTYARTHVGGSGRINGWHWRLLSMGGRIDSLSLQSPLPEIGIRPEEQSAADQAIRAAQSKPYPQSRKPVESVLKKHSDADVVVTFDLTSRLLGSMKGKVLAENVRSELRASELDSWQPLQEQMDRLLRLYPTEEGEGFYDLTDEKGFFRALRELLRQYQKAEESLRTAQPEARSQFVSFQKSLEVLLARLELLLDEDYSKLTEYHPGAAAATFGVMAVQIKPEILQDETPRQFFFGLFSLKQLTESGVLKVDLFDGAVVSPLPEVKGVLADRYPEVMREKLEQIQKLTTSFLEGFQDSRSELRTEETGLQDFVNRIISSHAWPDIIEVDIDPSLRIKQTSASLGFAIFELLKNAIDGNRVYEKKSGTDSRPDVRLTAAGKDGWVELRIENRGVLAVDKLRSQAREGGVWKLRPWAPDKHLWPYPYIMESSMPEEPMPYQRMRPEEVDAMADEDLLFHVKGLTLRSDENLRRIGLLRADLTGGMGIGLKQVWRVMEMVDPERPVHYEMGEIDGAPSVAFSVRIPAAASRSELRAPDDFAPALETADFFLKRIGTLSEVSSKAYSRLDLSPEGQKFFFETLKTTLAASFGEGMNGFTEKDVARTAYAVRDDKSGVPLGVLYQFAALPIFFDFIELTRPTTEAALLDRDHAGAWAVADQTARRVYQKKLGQVHFLERLTLAGLSSDRSRWLTEQNRLKEKASSSLLSLFVISEIQDWSRKADIFLRPDQVGSLDFQQALFRINRQRPEFFKSILGITGFGTGVDSLLAIRYGAEAIHGTEPYALVRLLGELNIRYARESGQISAELPVTVEMTKGLSKNGAVRTWFFNTPLVVKNGTRSTFMPANVHLPIALLPSTGSLYLEESEFQAILKEAASMMMDQPDKRAVMRVDGDFFTTPEKDLTAYLDSVRAYLEKFDLSLTGYYGGAFVEFQGSSFGRAGQEAYLKSAFQVREEDEKALVSEEALLWFVRQLESAAVTAADGGTVSRDTLENWKKKLLENPARSELRAPSEAEYEQIAAEAERLRELVEVHSLLRNKPDGTGKSDIVKALAEARDLSRERADIERIAEVVKRANGWYPGRVNTNYFQFDDRNIKKQLAAFSRSVQKVIRDSNAGRSELRMYINDMVRQQFVIAGVPFLDEHIPTDKGVFRPTLSGLVDPLTEYAGHYEPIRIIDLGSGQGAMVFAFARANDRAEVLGIEYDEQLFNDSVKVRDSFFEDTRKRIRLERGDFNDPRFAEEIQKADLVNYWETGARAEGTMLLNLAKNMRADARFLVTKNSGRFIKAVKDTGYFDLAEEDLDEGIFLFKRNEKPFEDLAAEKPGDRSELRSEEKDPSAVFQAWDDFMKEQNPGAHDPEKFRYLVHGINDPKTSEQLLEKLAAAHGGISKISADRKIDLIETPERISQKAVISASLIDQDHLVTFSPMGVILEAPAENILDTVDHMGDSPVFEDEEWVRKKMTQRKLKGPGDLLKGTHLFGGINEVMIAGTHPDKPESRTRIIGVYFKIDSEIGRLFSSKEMEARAARLEALAKENGWPVVFIQEPWGKNHPVMKNPARFGGEVRSELRLSEDGKFFPVRAVEKMTVPAAVFLDARELTQLKAGQADERFDELLTFLERHPAFDLYIDRGDQYPLHNLDLPKLRQILSEFPGRVHFGERSRANLAKKKILLQVSLFEDSGSSAETRKLIQDIQRRYRIQSDLLPVEYLLPGSLKGFLGLAESFTQAELIREIGEAYATRSEGGRWRLAADFAASLWARIQNDYAIQWSA